MNTNRVPAGSPEGGQWAKNGNPESTVTSLKSPASASPIERHDIDLTDRFDGDNDMTTDAFLLPSEDSGVSTIATVRAIPLSSQELSAAQTHPNLTEVSDTSTPSELHTIAVVDERERVLYLLESTSAPHGVTVDDAVRHHREATSYHTRDFARSLLLNKA